MSFITTARAFVYYIMKYATMEQQEIDPGKVDVLALFEKKLLGRKSAGGAANVDKATRRVLSLSYG